MKTKLSIILALSLFGCTQSSEHSTADSVTMSVENYTLPAGFSVIEQQPNGYFIRISSAERASSATINSIAGALASKFDRIDFCIDIAHERGDEYISIIGTKVFDYENDLIYTLNNPTI